jgi:putative addiction module component (TIGR02574 family)
MTEKTRALLEQALKLSPAERVKLANELWDSVDLSNEPEGFELSAEWREAIERRVEGILSGKTKGIPADEAIAMLRRERKEERRGHGETRSR